MWRRNVRQQRAAALHDPPDRVFLVAGQVPVAQMLPVHAWQQKVRSIKAAPATGLQGFRHQAEEMPDAHGGFQDLCTGCKPEALHRFQSAGITSGEVK